MRRGRGWVLGALGAAVWAAAGCQTHKSETEVPYKEEFRAPPDEDRFNNPPEQQWKPPPPKKEFRPGVGGPGGMGGGPGMGGMGPSAGR